MPLMVARAAGNEERVKTRCELTSFYSCTRVPVELTPRCLQNRKFDNRAGEIRLCNQLAQGKPCERPNCKNDHDLAAFFASRPTDIRRTTPATADDLTPVESPVTCPVFLSLGACPYGFKCRFGESHMRKVEDGQGFMQSGWELVVDEEKVAKRKAEIGEGKAKRSDRGEMNLMTMTDIKSVRGGGKSQVRAWTSCKAAFDDQPD